MPTPNSNSIDWESQWAQFAPGFKNGRAHIDLSPYGTKKHLLLQPGPGFGDLSHPTTSLMLACMRGEIDEQTILDIGCGSGILSLAALLMGAKRAIGIDIDEGALRHACLNAELNQLQQRTRFSITLPRRAEGVVLINMILLEQKTVLKTIPNLPSRASLWIASGFLTEQRSAALSFIQELGLQPFEEKQEGEWFALKCKRTI